MRRWLERAFDIRDSELALVLSFFGYFVGIGMFYTVGATVGDTLFLANLPPGQVPTLLPWVYAGIAVASLLATLLYDAVQRRVSRVALIVGAQLALALSVLAFRLLIGLDNQVVYFALVIWMEVCALLSITLFFSFAGDYFSSRDARRLYGFIVGGMALGTVVGGHSISVVVQFVETRNLLYPCAALLLLNALVAWRIHRVATPVPVEVEAGRATGGPTSLWPVFQRPYVRMVALAAALALMISVLVDYQMKWVASTKDEEELAQFFGTFWGIIGIAQLVFQFVLVPRLLARLGIINCLMIQPLLICAASLALLVAAPFGYFGLGLLAFSAANNFIRITLSETLDLPSREMLFLPLPTSIRQRLQPFMNGALAAGARGVGGLLLLLLFAGGVAVENLSVAAGIGCLLLIVALLRLRPRYRSTLAAALRGHDMDSADLREIVHSPTAEPVLDELLGSADPDVVRFTLRLLEDRPNDGLADRFAALLDGDDPAVVVAALRCVGADAPPELVLRAHYHTTSGEPTVREAAVLALCRATGEHAPDDVFELLESTDRVGRAAALIGLARYADEAARCVVRSILEEHTTSPSAATRVEAARSIGAIGRADAQPLLERLLVDAELPVRRAAIEAAADTAVIELMPQLLAALDEPELRETATRAIGAMPSGGVAPLVAYLKEGERPVDDRRLVCCALASIGGDEVARVLWAHVIDPAEDIILRNAAAGALRAIHRRQGIGRRLLPGWERLVEQLYELLELIGRARAEAGGVDPFADRLYGDHTRLTVELLLNLLALRHDPRQIDSILFNLFTDSAPLRTRALELLDELLPRKDANRIVPLLQPLVDRHPPRGAGLDPDTARRLATAPAWIRAGTAFHLASRAGAPDAPPFELSAGERAVLEQLPTITFMSSVAPLDLVPLNYLVEHAARTAWVELAAGDRLFDAGDPGDALFLVAAGELAVELGGEELTRLGPGECVGELALLIGTPRTATVRAAAAARLLRMPGAIVRQLIVAYPDCARALMAILDRRIRQTQALRDVQLSGDAPQQRLSHISLTGALDLTQIIPIISFLRRVELFAELPVSTLTRLAGIVEEVEFVAGEELFEQGDPGDSLYLIYSGEVDIIVDDRKVASLGQDACLGEMALIGCTARSATVRVAEDARMLRLGSEDFAQLLATEPEVALALLKTLALRLRQVSRLERPRPGG